MIDLNPDVETIETPGTREVRGVKSCKTMRSFFQARINDQVRHKDKEMEMVLRGLLKAYNYYHPELKATVKIKNFKGKSGIEIIKHPDYFETIQYRKTDNGVNKIKYNISKEQLNLVLRAVLRLEFKRKYQTRHIAQEYCKIAGLWRNSKGREFFDSEGFNYEQFSGSRSLYMDFNISLKILQFYQVINYFKNGRIEKLKNSINFQTNF